MPASRLASLVGPFGFAQGRQPRRLSLHEHLCKGLVAPRLLPLLGKMVYRKGTRDLHASADRAVTFGGGCSKS